MSTTRLAEAEIKQTVDFTRQRDFFDPTKSDARVTLVGCGGIGSATAVLLSKLGIPNLTLIDPDTLELHNVPNQFFPTQKQFLGKPKVEVLASMCRTFGYSEVEGHQMLIEDYDQKPSGIVVTGLDSMKARHAVWEWVKSSPAGVQYLVDGRIGGQEVVLWTVNPKRQYDVEQYENNALFDDAEGEEAPCTARAVIDVMGFVASLITNQVRKIVAPNQKFGEDPTDLLVTLSVPELGMQKWYKKVESEESTDLIKE